MTIFSLLCVSSIFFLRKKVTFSTPYYAREMQHFMVFHEHDFIILNLNERTAVFCIAYISHCISFFKKSKIQFSNLEKNQIKTEFHFLDNK